MIVKNWADGELLQRMFPEPGQQLWQIETAWREFINRFEKLLINAIRLTYKRYSSVGELRQEDLLQMVQLIFNRLSENDYRILRDLSNKEEDSIKLFLYSIAANTALDYLQGRQQGQQPGINSLLRKIKKRLVLFYNSKDLTEYQR